MKPSVLNATILIVAVVGVALAVYLIPENGATTGKINNVPREFGGFWLTSTTTGQEAISSVEQMHVGPPGAIKEAVIATYKDASNRKVQLWVADLEDVGRARIALLDMVEGIKKYPELGFTPAEKLSLSGTDVYVNNGAGGINTFWVEEDRVVYLLILQASLDDSLTITQTFMEQYRQII